MSQYSREHLSDSTLGRRLSASAAHDHAHTAELLADIAEFDARKLYLPAAHPSMHSYCVQELYFSDDAALKRIRAARAARKFPAIFEMVASGRLHLSGVVLLAPHLTPDNADELLAAATHETKAGIELLLAHRFPRMDVPARIQAIVPQSPSPTGAGEMGPGPVADVRAGFVSEVAPGPVVRHVPNDRVTPLSSRHFLLQVTLDHDTNRLLCRAQELLGHQVPSGNIGEVLKRSLDLLVRQIEKQRFAATDKPRASRGGSTASRHIPAHVRRAVWERDRGQCTFVSANGHHCPARTRLEFDHVEEVARGGRATVEGIRLRCRAHDQYTAECTFGVEFMRRKRDEARQAAALRGQAQMPQSHSQAQAARADVEPTAGGDRPVTTPIDAAIVTAATASEMAVEPERSGNHEAHDARSKTNPAEVLPSDEDLDVFPWLRRLGFRIDEARSAATYCASLSDASLEERIKAALRFLRPRVPSRRRALPLAT